MAVAGDVRDAIAASDIVVIATPYAASLDVARRLDPFRANKVVVDISNALNESYSGEAGHDVPCRPGINAASARALDEAAAREEMTHGRDDQ